MGGTVGMLANRVRVEKACKTLGFSKARRGRALERITAGSVRNWSALLKHKDKVLIEVCTL